MDEPHLYNILEPQLPSSVVLSAMVHETKKVLPLRPNHGGDGSNYTTAVLQKRWNHIKVRILRGIEPVEAHFMVAHAD